MIHEQETFHTLNLSSTAFFFLNISFHPWKQYCSKLSLQDDHTKWQTWVPEWLLACDYIVDVNSTHFANETFKIILLHRLFYVSELFLFKASALILIGSFSNCSKFNSLAALCKVSTSLPLANHCVYYCLLCIFPFFQNYIIIFLDSVTCKMCPKTRYYLFIKLW